MEKQIWVQLESLSKEKEQSKRLSSYAAIKRSFHVSELNLLSVMSDDHLHVFFDQIITDLKTNDEKLVQAILAILSKMFCTDNIRFTLKDEYANDLLESLIAVFKASKINSVLHKILDILANQNFSESVVELYVETILTAMVVTGSSFDNEYLNVIHKFLKQCPNEMEDNILLWVKITLELSAHSNVIMRQLAITTLKANLNLIERNKKKILSACATILKQNVLPALKCHCTKNDILQEILSSQLPVYIGIIGEDVKRSSSLSNFLLQFIEKGFRHAEESLKLSAFKTWDCFVDSLSCNKELIASSKYVKLLTQPLRLKLKSETLIKALIETMWKYVIHLEDNIPDLFEMVCTPLLEVCFGEPQSRLKPRRSSGRLSMSKEFNPYKSIQVLGAEILMHLLCDVSKLQHSISLAPLAKPWIGSPCTFARFFSTLMPAVCDVICYLNQPVPEEFLRELWNTVIQCTHTNVTRKRDIDMFRTLYQCVHRMVTSDVPPSFLLEVVSSLITFPIKILNSSLHSTSETSVGTMHATPILSILQFLLCPRVYVVENINNPRFLECAKFIISGGMQRSIGNLEYIHSLTQHLSEDHIIFLEMWNCLCEHAIDYVVQSGNINQGDSLEHDFTAMYDLFLFPVRFMLTYKMNIDAARMKSVIMLWTNLFEEFSFQSSAVTNTKTDEGRSYLASHILSHIESRELESLPCERIEFFEEVAFALLNNAFFSNLDDNFLKANKKSSALESSASLKLNGFNSTIARLLNCLETVAFNSDEKRKSKVMKSVTYIFSHIPQELATLFFFAFLELFILNFRKISSSADHEDLNEAWKAALLRLPFTQSLFSDAITRELFAIAFSHSSEHIYRITVEFWEMKAKDSADTSTLPNEFLSVLCDVYEKEGFKIDWSRSSSAVAVDLNVSSGSPPRDIEVDKQLSVPIVVLKETISESDVSGSPSTFSGSAMEMTSCEAHKIVGFSAPASEDDYVLASSEVESSSSNPSPHLSRSVNLRDLAISVDKMTRKVKDVLVNIEVSDTGKTHNGKTPVRKQTGRKRKSKPVRSRTGPKRKCKIMTTSKDKEFVVEVACEEVKESERKDLKALEREFMTDDESMIAGDDGVQARESPLSKNNDGDGVTANDGIVLDSDASQDELYISASSRPSCDEEFTGDNRERVTCVSTSDNPGKNPHLHGKLDDNSVYEVVLMTDVSMNCEENGSILNDSADPELTQIDSSEVDKSQYEVVEMAEMSSCPLTEVSEIAEEGFKDNSSLSLNLPERSGEAKNEITDFAATSCLDEQTSSRLSDDISLDQSAVGAVETMKPLIQVKPSEKNLPEDKDFQKLEERVPYEDIADRNVDDRVNETVAISSINLCKNTETGVSVNMITAPTRSDETLYQERENETNDSICIQEHSPSDGTMDDCVYETVKMVEISLGSSSNFGTGDSYLETSVFEEEVMLDASINCETNETNFDNTNAEENVSEVAQMSEVSVNLSRNDEIITTLSDQSTCTDENMTDLLFNDDQTREDGQHTMSKVRDEEEIEISVNSKQERGPCITGNAAPCISSSSFNLQQPIHKVVTKPTSFDDSFDACAQDLGVEPLDSSFETGDSEDKVQERHSENPHNEKRISQAAKQLLLMHKKVIRESVETTTEDDDVLEEESMTPIRRSKRIGGSLAENDLVDSVVKLKSNSNKRLIQKSKELSSANETIVNKPQNDFDLKKIAPEKTVPVENLQQFQEIDSKTNLNDNVFKLPDSMMSEESENVNTCSADALSEQEQSGLSQSPLNPGTNDINIPQTTPKSCLGKRVTLMQEDAKVSPVTSPSILKKKMSDLSPATKLRRVSFAEPISTSTECDVVDILESPSKNADWRRNKFTSKVVSRRLSLPVPKRSTTSIHGADIARSPMSVRSATVAAAIAGIKAKNTEGSNTCQSVKNAVLLSKHSPGSVPLELDGIAVSQLNNDAFLRAMSPSQLTQLIEFVLESTPILHSILIQKLKRK